MRLCLVVDVHIHVCALIHSVPQLTMVSCISPRQIQSNSSLWSLFVFNSPPCRPLCSILIYSALLLSVHSASLSFMVDHIACPRGISIMLVVLCLTHYITDFYTYSTYFFTAIFLTTPNTLPVYFFCPKI